MKVIFSNVALPGSLAATLLFCPIAHSQSNECQTEINGALKGGSGNIQDHMFHSLAIDPTNEDIVYVGTETNGIFKTTDGGRTWIRLRKGLKCTTQQTGYPQIFDIAIDRTNPEVLYAATVNGPGPADNAVYTSASAGIYRSTDGGMTWVQKVTGFTNTYTTYVLIDATNPTRLYAGLGGVKSTFSLTLNRFFEGGVWVSDNSGDSWSPLSLPDGVNTNVFIDMVLRGMDQQSIYASAQLHGTDAPVAYGLVRSTDAGRTWSIVNPAGVTIYGFDVYKKDPNIIYGHDNSPSRRVHKSTDGGNTWNVIPSASFFGTVRIHPDDSQTLFYTGRTSIMKSTDGLSTSRSTYNDTDLSPNQQMLDIEISQSNPNVVWACAKGYYLYKSTDGGESFTKITEVRDLVYGSAVSQNLPAVGNHASSLNVIAMVRSGKDTAQVTLTAYENSGSLMTTEAGRNPFIVSVPAGGQLSRLVSELFGSDTNRSGGWIKVTSERPGISGLFLNFNPPLTAMDGANFSNRLSADFVLPEIKNAEVSLVNPSDTVSADVFVTLINNDGVEQPTTQSIRIPPNGRYTNRVSEMFASSALTTDGYLRVSSNQGLVSLEQFGIEGKFTNSLNGLHADTGARLLYSPQYVIGGGYTTMVTLINLVDARTTVSLSWVDSSGAQRGRVAKLALAARGRAVITGAEIFGLTVPASGLEGYLRISSDTTQVTGAVRFGDAAEERFQTSLALLSQGQNELIFPLAVQDAALFTEVAIINANSDPANVVLSIYNNEGTQVGTGRRTLASNTRVSGVLTQFDPTLPLLSSGYFKITSDRPVLGFGVIGTNTMSALVAIVAQPVWP